MVQASRAILHLLAAQRPSGLRGAPVSQTAAVSDLAAYGLRAWGLTLVRLGRLSKRGPAPELQALLAVAFSCIERGYRPSPIVVSQAVEAARHLGGIKAASFVNAILRRVFADPHAAQEDLRAPVAQANAPDWYWQRLKQAGDEVYAAHCRSVFTPPAFVLRYLAPASQRHDWTALLQARGHRLSWVADKTVLVAPAAAVEDIPGFAEGVFRVQDSSAQRAAGLLPLRAGDCVLDACAAPGGKTFLLSEQPGVHVWAVDVSRQRLARLEKEWTRIRHYLGGGQVHPFAADLSQASWPQGLPAVYDHVVLDAPCSGSGVVRRHPESAWVRHQAQVDSLVALQSLLLDRLWQVLRPGGQLLYITCSVFPQEGEAQILQFLARTPDALRKPAPGQILPYYRDDPSFCVSGDGFFYARLEKRLT